VNAVRSKFVMLVATTGLLSFVQAGAAMGSETGVRRFYVPLTDATGLVVEGKHRFVSVKGLSGFQPTSVHTRAYVETRLHQGERGTLSFWFSPLENLDFFPNAGNRMREDRHVFYYPFVSDVFPPNQADQMRFGVFWYNHDPQVLGKFASGGIWSSMDYTLPPFVAIEKVPMHARCWYLLTMTWDKAARTIDIYVNGILMNYNHEAAGFMDSGDRLYIGCPMMVMRELELTDRVLSPGDIKAAYQRRRPAGNEVVDAEIARLTTPAYGPDSDLRLDGSWKRSYSCSFTEEGDLDGWRFQTDKAQLDAMVVKITPEGLCFKTPDKIDNATRLTLWGPKTFEGDQWLEVDFRLESPRGLALVVLCASGMGREDFIDDHELEMVGKMSPILAGTRNYHWEFVRRVNVIRTDMETQVIYKNPWGRHLYYGVIPKIEQHRWYKLRLVKMGSRLQGSLDGRVVFDLRDDASGHTGPVLNFGRIALRHMYHTTVRYRNLVVYERKTE
jgi:hypothetical protein